MYDFIILRQYDSDTYLTSLIIKYYCCISQLFPNELSNLYSIRNCFCVILFYRFGLLQSYVLLPRPYVALCPYPYLFTPVCESFCSREGVCLSACWDTPSGTHPTGMHTCFP